MRSPDRRLCLGIFVLDGQADRVSHQRVDPGPVPVWQGGIVHPWSEPNDERTAAQMLFKRQPKVITPARPVAPKTGGGAAPARTTKVKADAAPGEAAKAAEKPAEKPADRAAEAERKDKHEKVERDSFSMPASEHKRIKALREALGKDGVLASKSEVLRAGLALLAERDIAEVARLVAALPKVAKGKRARKH